MLKRNIICLLWLFLAIAVFSSCYNAVDECDGIEIKDPRFLKISLYTMIKDFDILNLEPVDKFTFGDTMVISCYAKNPNWTDWDYEKNRDRPIEPPIVAKITSFETGDVQYVTLIQDPFATGELHGIGLVSKFFPFIAYISPVKHEETSGIPHKLIPDPTRKELNISSNGDILTAEITYKCQILTKTITVKGE
jgi:hypothetical protein